MLYLDLNSLFMEFHMEAVLRKLSIQGRTSNKDIDITM